MMKRILCLLFILVLSVFLTSCVVDNQGEEIPEELQVLYQNEFYYDECCYMPGWSSLSIEAYTDMFRGIVFGKLENNGSIKYKEVAIDENLSEWSFAFTFNCTLKKENLVKRYDVYKDNQFQQYTYLIDKDKNIYYIKLIKYEADSEYTFNEGFSIKAYYQHYDYENVDLINETEEERKVTKDEFINGIPKMIEIYNKSQSEKQEKNYLVDLSKIFPQSKCVIMASGVLYDYYVVGDNLIYSDYYDFQSKKLYLRLAYYLNGKLVLICDNPNYFEEFINDYYNDSYYGMFNSTENENIFVSISLVKNSRIPVTFTANLYKDESITKQIIGSYTKEDGYLILKPYGFAALLYFRMENNTLIYEGQNIFDSEMESIDIDIKAETILHRNKIPIYLRVH